MHVMGWSHRAAASCLELLRRLELPRRLWAALRDRLCLRLCRLLRRGRCAADPAAALPLLLHRWHSPRALRGRCWHCPSALMG